MTASFVTYPLDLTKTLLAVRIDNSVPGGIFSMMKHVWKKQGFFALYKGLIPSLIGIAPYASLKLTFY